MKLQSPTREELINMRQCHGLTQIHAAAIAMSSLRTWQYWERGDHADAPSHLEVRADRCACPRAPHERGQAAVAVDYR